MGTLVTQLILARDPIINYLTIHLVAPLRRRNHRQLGAYWRRRQNKNKMKENIMKQLLALICGAILIVAYAQAQTSTTSSTTTSNPTTNSMTSDTSNTTTSASSSSGTVTDYTPGAAITLDPGTGKPVHFIISKKVQVVGPDGKLLADTDLKKNAKVHLRLVQYGDRTVVDKITVDEAK